MGRDLRFCVCCFSVTLLFSLPASAARLILEPSLQLKETYTDNITFSEPKQDDFVSEINPELGLRAEGNRLNANLGLALQNLFYANDSSRNSRYHTFGADVSAELLKDSGFLNLRASDTQRVVSPSRGLPLDNLTTAKRTDVQALAVNPFVKRRIGSKAEASASYSYEMLRYEEGASDARVDSVEASLVSGAFFQRLSWSMNYSARTTRRQSASDYSRESSVFQALYRVSNKFGALLRVGTERNDLGTTQYLGYRNGSYYAAGVSIAPHSTFKIDLLKGNWLDAISVAWKPSPRTEVDISWEDRRVGLNIGEVWSVRARLDNRRTSLRASYTEDIASVQSLQSLGAGFQQVRSSASARSNRPVSPPPGNDLSNGAFQLSNALFLRKRAQFSLGYRTAKSEFSFLLYGERRELLDTDDREQLRGGAISWRWRFGARTDMLLRFRALKSEYRASVGGGGGGFRSAGVIVNRRVGRKVEGSLVARNVSQDGLIGGFNYNENRLSVSVKRVF